MCHLELSSDRVLLWDRAHIKIVTCGVHGTCINRFIFTNKYLSNWIPVE